MFANPGLEVAHEVADMRRAGSHMLIPVLYKFCHVQVEEYAIDKYAGNP
jgi:hypothetical protein